ncbi:hypothetical protein LCGC14_0909940 [marine sediment metagenome]|uniref:Uncharacterized protein n=1 Tax=marine sediment metagenome TaxID=412755 RepID=A0A0F9RCV1_9ZZZZ
MNDLGLQSLAFAKRYVSLTDALMSQGVAEAKAREEARATALIMMYHENPDNPCPLCGGDA